MVAPRTRRLARVRRAGAWVLGAMAVVVAIALALNITRTDPETLWEEECWAGYDSARTLRDTQLVDIRRPSTSIGRREAGAMQCGDLRRSWAATERHRARTANAGRPGARR